MSAKDPFSATATESRGGARPLVTVLIPAYNAAQTIGRALDSVFRQDYPSFEVIVVNDASRDDTARVVEQYGRPEITVYTLPENRGECGAMNYGLERAKGEFVAFLDADDQWMDSKLAKQMPLLEANPRMTFVSCGCLFVDRDGTPFREFGLSFPFQPDKVWRGLLAATFVAKPCVIARRAALTQVGAFDPALAVAGDQDMWIRLAMAGEVGIVKELLVKAFDTPNSLTKKYATRTMEFVLPMIQRHIAAQENQLSKQEIKEILGQRYSSLGRNLYLTGEIGAGVRFLMKAIFSGYRVGENLWYLVTASPPSRWIKRVLGKPQAAL